MPEQDAILVSLAFTPDGKLKLLFDDKTSGILRKVYVNNHSGGMNSVDFECSDGTLLSLTYVPE